MSQKNETGGKFARFFEEKGFYIILFLCVVAIGIAGYVFLIPSEDTTTNDMINRDTLTMNQPETEDSLPLPVSGTTPSDETETVDSEPEPESDTAASGTNWYSVPSSVKNGSTNKPVLPEKKTEPTFFVNPVPGELLNAFSGSELVYNRTMEDWRTHNGVDLAAFDGEKVCSIASGTVTSVSHDTYHGTRVEIDHGNGMLSVYTGLMEQAGVTQGQSVNAGDIIGAVDANALFEVSQPVHLHLEILQNGVYVDPMTIIPG